MMKGLTRATGAWERVLCRYRKGHQLQLAYSVVDVMQWPELQSFEMFALNKHMRKPSKRVNDVTRKCMSLPHDCMQTTSTPLFFPAAHEP